ncbi:MAG: hypothetical protein OEV78_06890 [Spirochaetia bacterium]|nr:hypothetical protein [Spirochaetia bacterium]
MKRKILFKNQMRFKVKSLIILSLAFSCPAFGQVQADQHLYFKDIYKTRFTSMEQAEKTKSENESDFTILLEYAHYCYVTGAQMPPKDKTGLDYVERAFETYQKLWKKKFSDPNIQFYMANAYASQGNNPRINMGTLVEYVFRARNLYSMIIDLYPQNLEARLGRARINMNLNAATGRPDAVHHEDIRVYLEGYAKLPQDLKEHGYYKMGLMEMYLAQAMLDVEAKQWSEVQKNIKLIDTALLHVQAKKLYQDVLNELKKGAAK